MVDVVQAWLLSGDYAILNNVPLVPRSDGTELGLPMLIESDEGVVYFLVGRDGRGWILKKFRPGQIPNRAYADAIPTLIPRDRGFESGFGRITLRGTNVSQSGFDDSEFRRWIEDTVLMPQIAARTWADVARSIRTEAALLHMAVRILICSQLSKLIASLESHGLAHRDLSARNILVDSAAGHVHVVDWESLYHASLRMQAETTCGTNGYMAPFVKVNGEEDVYLSWRGKADRFALAVLNCEFLAMRPESISVEEGGLLKQSDIDMRSGRTVLGLSQALKITFPPALDLLNQAISARTFEECPSPNDWLELFRTHRTLFNPDTQSAQDG